MHLHASCAARSGPVGYDAILLMGPSGAGKSDMMLRLIGAGWTMVADDRVEIEGGIASAPAELAGVLEVRGLGLFRLPFIKSALVRLVVQVGVSPERLPEPKRHEVLNLPLVTIDGRAISAVEQINLALEAACGRLSQLSGAFAV